MRSVSDFILLKKGIKKVAAKIPQLLNLKAMICFIYGTEMYYSKLLFSSFTFLIYSEGESPNSSLKLIVNRFGELKPTS